MEFFFSCVETLKNISKSRVAMFVWVFVIAVAFFPALPGMEGFSQWRQENSVWLTILGLLAASVLFVNSCYWIKDQVLERYMAAKAKSNDWLRFLELDPSQQKFLIDLYVSGAMTGSVVYGSKEVVTMSRYGYLSLSGAVRLDDLGRPMVNATLTPQARQLFSSNKGEMLRLGERLLNESY